MRRRDSDLRHQAWRIRQVLWRKRSAFSFQLCVLLMIGAAYPTDGALAEDGSSKEPITIRKTEDRLHFQLPADWPVEKRNGVMGPIPIEEYLAKKFGAIESRLQSIEQRVNGFDVRLRALEEQNKKQTQTLKSTGAQ